MKSRFLYGIFVLLPLLAQAQLVLPQSFQVPIERAFEKNKEIQNKQLDLAITEAERRSVTAKFIPRLEATGGYVYFDNKVTLDIPTVTLPISGIEFFEDRTKINSTGNLLHGGLMAKTVLFSGFQISHGAKALKQKYEGDSLLIETDRDELIIQIVTSFDKLRFIKASEELLADSDRRLKKEEERVNRAIANGLAIPFDRDRIKLARLELESAGTELEESRKLLFHLLHYLTGMTEEEILNVSYDLDPIVLPENLKVDQKQELLALEAYKRAGEYLLKKEKGSFLPQAAAFAGVSYTSLFDLSSGFNIPYLPSQLPQPELNLKELTIAPSWMAGVALTWEIFGGTERKHKVQGSRLRLSQLENKLEDSRDKLNLLLQEKEAAYSTRWKQIDLATQQELIAKNTLSLAEKQYSQGLISVSDRLEAENDFVKAGQKMTGALIDQRKAALEALAVTGNLFQQIQFQ